MAEGYAKHIDGGYTQMQRRSHSRLGRLRLHTVHDLDGRTRAARRARVVVAELVKALGGPDAVSPGQRQACERTGMLTAIAEDLAARQLAGLSVCLDEVLRAEGVARRAVAAVLASKTEPAPTERPGLALARARWAEQDAAKQNGDTRAKTQAN